MVRRKRSEPSSSSRRIACVLAVGVLLCVPAAARADEVEPVALRYEGSGACSSEQAFVTKVRSYTNRWKLVEDGGAGVRTIRVRVSEGPDVSTGKLTVGAADGTSSEREIKGPTCSEVSEALAVMVAVAIDPRAGAPGGTAEGAPDEIAAPVATARPEHDRPRPKAAPRASRRPEPSAQPESPKEASAVRLSFEGRLETTSAVIRGGLQGIGLSVGADLMRSATRRGIQVAAPSLAVGLRQTFSKERALRGGSVDVAWTAGSLRLCPFRLVVETVVEVSPCAESNIGVLDASARGFADAKDRSTFWLDVGGSAVTAVRLSDRVFFSASFGVIMPLFRQPFVLASGARAATVPPLGVLGGVGVGFRL